MGTITHSFWTAVEITVVFATDLVEFFAFVYILILKLLISRANHIIKNLPLDVMISRASFLPERQFHLGTLSKIAFSIKHAITVCLQLFYRNLRSASSQYP